MPSPEEVNGEGFRIIGHEEPAEEKHGPQAAAEAPAEGAEAPPDREPGRQPGEEAAGPELRPLDVWSVLHVCIGQLAGVAWQTMGLRADPFTNKMSKDLGQARVAIDATAALVELLLPQVQGQEKRDLQALLTDLRLNFVRQQGEREREKPADQ